MSKINLVFAYGTLQTGERNFEKFMSGAESLGRSRTLESGFLMGHHKSASSPENRTPGVVRIGLNGSHIEGEIFSVTEKQLKSLDGLKGIGGDTYYRQQVTLENGKSAWAYLLRKEETFQHSPHITYDRAQNTYCWKETPAP